jgi:hypothetical protein
MNSVTKGSVPQSFRDWLCPQRGLRLSRLPELRPTPPTLQPGRRVPGPGKNRGSCVGFSRVVRIDRVV